MDDFGDHIVNLGRFVEDVESRLRNSLQDLYFGKVKDVVGELRKLNTGGMKTQDKANMQAELFAKLMARRSQMS